MSFVMDEKNCIFQICIMSMHGAYLKSVKCFEVSFYCISYVTIEYYIKGISTPYGMEKNVSRSPFLKQNKVLTAMKNEGGGGNPLF